ncbi:LA2681 family HEPN domain-containing protein [Flagellimonas sp.]|uniref:LA2681 family HEPN domain-containing protein n=1 Tax=Flagellimonas sp. TaxID=2058762 RepID=UPI003BB0AD42
MNIYNPDELIQLSSFTGMDPEDIVISLQTLFEHGRGINDTSFIEKGLALGKGMEFEDFFLEQIQAFHFNMANGWSYLYGIKGPQDHLEIDDFNPAELEQQIIHLRLALSIAESLPPDTRKSEVLTNLGILFHTIGRFSEGLQYYRRALDITPGYGQTLANHSNTVLGYARILYDGGQQTYFFKNAYENLGASLKGDLYEETRVNVEIMRVNIESIFTNNELNHDYKESSFDLGGTSEEVSYRKWVLKNGLFLNPLNDLTRESIAAHDCLLLPSLTAKHDGPEFYQILFNQIKQEFGTARYLYFEGIQSLKPHFSDKGNLQLDFSKGINYSLAVEKLKIAFKISYSIFDKVAYLLNDYLELGWDLNRVSFRRIWYSSNKGPGTTVLDKINATENWAFRGLFWLNKDFYEKSFPYLSSIQPESKEVAEIRNYLEHKSINILANHMEVPNEVEKKSYWIKREDLEKKTLTLLHTARAAMIYLSLGINLEEYKRPRSGPTIPIYPNVRDDNTKL